MALHQQQHARSSGKAPRTAPLAALKLPCLAEKTYRGIRHPDGHSEVLVEKAVEPASGRFVTSSPTPLPLHLEVRQHSPTGFAWGYGGSGPAQLALALLLDATGSELLALRHYQKFKRQFLVGWGHTWSITAREIRAFIAGQER